MHICTASCLPRRAGAMQQEPIVQLGSVLACKATCNMKFTVEAGITTTG